MLGVLLIYLHSPSDAAHPQDRAYISVNVVHSPYDIRRTFLSPGSYIPLIEV